MVVHNFGRKSRGKSMKGAGNFSYSKVDLSRPHFLIYHSTELGCNDWRPIAVLSDAPTVADMQLALLTHDAVDLPVLKMMHKELNFYLLELKNTDPGAYLQYHCSTTSNIYSRIHFSYIENIHKKNIFYFIETECKLLGLHNTAPVMILQEKYVDIIVNNLFGDALGLADNQFYGSIYNDNLIILHDLCFNGIPTVNNFKIDEPLTLVEFSKKIAGLDIRYFCNIINYLKKIKLLKFKDVKEVLYFYHLNKKQHQDLQTIKS